jgi:hypothetical protein
LARAVKPIAEEHFATLTTQRLLAYRDRLLGLEDSAETSDVDRAEVAALDRSLLHFKADPRWVGLYDAVKRELARRQHLAGKP